MIAKDALFNARPRREILVESSEDGRGNTSTDGHRWLLYSISGKPYFRFGCEELEVSEWRKAMQAICKRHGAGADYAKELMALLEGACKLAGIKLEPLRKKKPRSKRKAKKASR